MATSCRLFAALFLFPTLHRTLGFSTLLSQSFCKRKCAPKRARRKSLCHLSLGAAHCNDNNWKNDLLDMFSGDFDNYDQVVEDRSRNRFPREGGGHEQIHCTLIPLSKTTRLAAFYFDGLPVNIFRFRYYQFVLQEEEFSDYVNMKLYTLHPSLEQELRATSDPTTWPRIVTDYKTAHPNETLVKELSKCDVQWSRKMDPVQHEYAIQEFPARQQSFHAVMVYGEALVESTMIPGQQILIKDQLSLSESDFWIHDRGFDPETGNYIYGNQRNIPYQLKRVTRMDENGKREIVSGNLQWTLGEAWRTEEEYQQHMALLGGVSSKLNS